MKSESEAARAELGELEQEIARVKALLRELGLPASASSNAIGGGGGGGGGGGAAPSSSEGDGTSPLDAEGVSSSSTDVTNALTVAWISTEETAETSSSESNPETAGPIEALTIQLSSPVEEATLAGLWDPDRPEGTTCTFRGVETGQATLTVVGTIRNGKVTGTSLHDLAPLLKFDAMDADAKFVESTFVAPLVAAAPAPAPASEDPDKEGADDDKEEAEVSVDDEPVKSADAPASSSSTPDGGGKVLGSVTLRLTFRPSAQDRREELYEILNRVTQRKAAAVERLRSAAVAEQRRMQQQQQQQQLTTSPGKSMVTRTGAPSQSAVRAGFLNKAGSKEEEKKPWKIRILYEKYLGPNSLTRQIFPIARNYLTFAVAVYLMHTKGQLLALPAPV